MSPAQGRTAAATSCRRVLLFGVLPFVAGVWLVLVTFRHQGLPERLQAGQALTLRQNCSQAPGADGVACDCIGAAAGNGTAEGLLATRFGAGGLDELVSASGNASIAAAGTGRLPGGKLESIFLFVGILSGRGYRHRRLAVREAWATGCQQKGVAVCRFILSEDEITPQVQKELDEFGDIVFVKEKTNYKSILVKTYFVLEYAALHYDVRYILKTDDDAYINISAMLRQLRLLCQTPDCRNERLYMGKMAKESEVLLQPGHKWNNILFHNHTGLKMYPNYMMGGGYVLSGDVVTTLININRRMKLIFTPIEDATLGFWLMAMDLRHIDHAKRAPAYCS